MKTIGGQALIEGVMIISENRVAMSVRKHNGKIKTSFLKKLNINDKFRRIFFIRGIISLIEMLYLGTKALIWSSNEAIDEKEEKISNKEIGFTLIFSLIFGIGIFVLLPLYITKLITNKGILFNLIDGVFRIIIFMIYLLIISRFKDIQRVFQYHGAEHMAVHCYEKKMKLAVNNVKRFPTLHPRCGTAFLIIVLIVSIFVFSFILSGNFLVKFLSRILLIPIIAGISYEILKLGAKFPNNFILKALIKPGLWFQMITTKKPDNRQIEIAIKSVNSAVR